MNNQEFLANDSPETLYIIPNKVFDRISFRTPICWNFLVSSLKCIACLRFRMLVQITSSTECNTVGVSDFKDRFCAEKRISEKLMQAYVRRSPHRSCCWMYRVVTVTCKYVAVIVKSGICLDESFRLVFQLHKILGSSTELLLHPV